MLILAIDTTSEWGGAVIFSGSSLIAQVHQEGPPNYSVSLFQLVNTALGAAGVELPEIDVFAAATGPGSFTGIRVGLAAALGWSRAFEKALIGVSNFEAMAESSKTDADWVLPLLDARRGEFYAELLQRSAPVNAASPCRFQTQGDGGWVLKPEHLASMLASQIERDSLACITREEDSPARALRGVLPLCRQWLRVSGFLAPAIAHLAWRAIQQGRPASSIDLTPHYVRRTDAELKLKY